MNLAEQQFKTAFLSVEGIGRAALTRVQKVLALHQLDEFDFWQQPHQALCLEAKLTAKQQHSWHLFRQQYQPVDYWQFLQEHQIKVAFDSDENYPELLKNIDDRPAILFIKNVLPPTINLPIAVVGTRKITGYGQMVTEKIVKELASFAATIVSGLMYGVDSAAHDAALNAGATTIGVLGYGFNHCYPSSHRLFLDSFLARGGVCISELAPHVKADPYNFPARNRIVAGMSLGVVVTEAGLQSGSHITAARAGEYGREVFAVPGPITNLFCEGTKWLINQGAILVSSGQEIMTVLTNKTDTQPLAITPSFNNIIEQKIYQALQIESLTTDDLAHSLSMPIADLTATLSLLEIQGYIKQVGDLWLVK